jgi:hypothetical protein
VFKVNSTPFTSMFPTLMVSRFTKLAPGATGTWLQQVFRFFLVEINCTDILLFAKAKSNPMLEVVVVSHFRLASYPSGRR